MANHLRRQIREAIVTALTGLTTTGARVFASRVYPLEAADLPGLLITTLSELSGPIDMGEPRTLERSVTLEVAAIAKSTADLDDVLDQICKEVEVALAMPVTALAGIAKSITLTATDIEVMGSGEQPFGRARLSYTVDYYAAENAPDVAL